MFPQRHPFQCVTEPKISRFNLGRKFGSNTGFVIPLVMLFASVFSVTIAGLWVYSGSVRDEAKFHESHSKTFYLAEGAVQKALAQIQNYIDTNGVVPNAAAIAAMSGSENSIGVGSYYQVEGYSVDIVSQESNVALDEGDYSGLSGSTTTIRVYAKMNDLTTSGMSGVSLAQTVEVQQIPVFQFGVFYDDDLEILPGPTMNFTGPVHSNADIYLGAENQLNFDSSLTAYGDIYHHRKNDSSTMPGNIRIKDVDGGGSGTPTYQNMKDSDGISLDSDHPDWATESQTRWDGKVKSGDHSVSSLSIPIGNDEDASVVIERRDDDDTPSLMEQKIDYKAHIRLIDGQVLDSSGNVLDLSYSSGGTTVNPISFPSQSFSGDCNQQQHFNNFRENKCIKATEIDIAKLSNSPAFQAIQSANPGGVIIYQSDRRHSSISSYQDALRLKNGSELPSSMSFVSENPVYVKGDFNSVNKKLVGIAADSFNVLSNAWQDSNSLETNKNNRTANSTTINAAVIAGNSVTSTGNYNGGFENIHRFHENWSGKTLSYSGSVAVLYQNQIGTGSWSSQSYSAPNRDWGYDTDLSDPSASIPGFPSVIHFVTTEWTPDYVL